VSCIYDTLDDGLLKPKHVVKERVQKIHVKFSCELGIGVLLYFIPIICLNFFVNTGVFYQIISMSNIKQYYICIV
jgi:hypothetical protein